MSERIGWRALARYLARESSPAETAAVEAWTRADAHHAEILDSARRAWASADLDSRKFDPQRAWSVLSERLGELETLPSSARATSRPRWRGRRVLAASVLLAAAIAFLVLVPLIRQPRSPASLYVTAPNQVMTLHLKDGSVVRLAPGTALNTGANGAREAWLKKGTAFFAVAKQHGQPFVVHTPSGDARVLGTRFELRSSPTGVRLVVFEGRVALAATGGREIVQAGQASVAQAGHAPSRPRPVDVQQVSPWLNGVLIFQSTPLSTVATEIARQYHVQVQLADSELAARTVTAAFEHQSLQVVVLTVCRVADAICEIKNNAVSMSR